MWPLELWEKALKAKVLKAQSRLDHCATWEAPCLQQELRKCGPQCGGMLQGTTPCPSQGQGLCSLPCCGACVPLAGPLKKKFIKLKTLRPMLYSLDWCSWETAMIPSEPCPTLFSTFTQTLYLHTHTPFCTHSLPLAHHLISPDFLPRVLVELTWKHLRLPGLIQVLPLTAPSAALTSSSWLFVLPAQELSGPGTLWN